jgi:hypothetical protein
MFSCIRHQNYFVPKFPHMINIGFDLLLHFLYNYLLIHFLPKIVIIYSANLAISDSFNSRYHLSITEENCSEFLKINWIWCHKFIFTFCAFTWLLYIESYLIHSYVIMWMLINFLHMLLLISLLRRTFVLILIRQIYMSTGACHMTFIWF